MFRHRLSGLGDKLQAGHPLIALKLEIAGKRLAGAKADTPAAGGGQTALRDGVDFRGRHTPQGGASRLALA